MAGWSLSGLRSWISRERAIISGLRESVRILSFGTPVTIPDEPLYQVETRQLSVIIANHVPPQEHDYILQRHLRENNVPGNAMITASDNGFEGNRRYDIRWEQPVYNAPPISVQREALMREEDRLRAIEQLRDRMRQMHMNVSQEQIDMHRQGRIGRFHVEEARALVPRGTLTGRLEDESVRLARLLRMQGHDEIQSSQISERRFFDVVSTKDLRETDGPYADYMEWYKRSHKVYPEMIREKTTSWQNYIKGKLRDDDEYPAF